MRVHSALTRSIPTCLAVIGAACLLASCGDRTYGRPASVSADSQIGQPDVEGARPPKAERVMTYGLGDVYHGCDKGRAVYVSKSGYSGGIVVIDNAPECAGERE